MASISIDLGNGVRAVCDNPPPEEVLSQKNAEYIIKDMCDYICEGHNLASVHSHVFGCKTFNARMSFDDKGRSVVKIKTTHDGKPLKFQFALVVDPKMLQRRRQDSTQ